MCRPPIPVFAGATALGKCLLLSKSSAIGLEPPEQCVPSLEPRNKHMTISEPSMIRHY